MFAFALSKGSSQTIPDLVTGWLFWGHDGFAMWAKANLKCTYMSLGIFIFPLFVAAASTIFYRVKQSHMRFAYHLHFKTCFENCNYGIGNWIHVFASQIVQKQSDSESSCVQQHLPCSVSVALESWAPHTVWTIDTWILSSWFQGISPDSLGLQCATNKSLLQGNHGLASWGF